eukprot:g2230.t1
MTTPAGQPQPGVKAALLEWLNSFDVGRADSFADLQDLALVCRVVGKICSRSSGQLKDFSDVRLAVYDSLADETRRRMFHSQDFRVLERPVAESVLYSLLTFVVLVAVECSEKNAHIAAVMKLSPPTQRVIMQIIQGLHAEVERVSASHGNTPGTYSLEQEGERVTPTSGAGGAQQLRVGTGPAASSSSRSKATSSAGSQHHDDNRNGNTRTNAELQKQIEQLRAELFKQLRERDEALHELSVEHESRLAREPGRPAIEGVRAEEKEKEWRMQVTTLRDEADLLRSQLNDSRLLKAKAEGEKWREKYEEAFLLYESARDAAAGGEHADALAAKLREDVERLRKDLKSAEVEKAELLERTTLLEAKLKTAEETARELQIGKEMAEVEVSRLRAGEAGSSSNAEQDSLQQDALREQLRRYRAQVSALKQALEGVKRQLLAQEEEGGRSGSGITKEGGRAATTEEGEGPAEARTAELEAKLAEAYRTTMAEREKALQAMQETSQMAAELSNVQEKLREVQENNKTHLTKTNEAGASASGAGPSGGTNAATSKDGGKGKEEAAAGVALLREQLETERRQWDEEQRLMSSTFHEIGLRYHQLLSEYKHVLRETGRQDMLFQK